jgi:hypothetical protein
MKNTSDLRRTQRKNEQHIKTDFLLQFNKIIVKHGSYRPPSII